MNKTKYYDLFIENQNSDELLKKLMHPSFDESTIISFYEEALLDDREGSGNHLKTLFRHPFIRNRFIFMDAITIEEFIDNDNTYNLAFPYFNTTNTDYVSLLKFLFEKDNIRSYKKRVGIGIKCYGTVFINNLFILRNFFDLDEILDELLNTHPHEIFSPKLLNLKINVNDFVRTLSFQNFYLLLKGPQEWYITKIEKMLEVLIANNKINELNLILKNNKKPSQKKLSIYSKLHALYGKTEITNLSSTPLNQTLVYLEGKKIENFTINIPKYVSDLVSTGIEMQHCLGSDLELVTAVLNGEIEIINLKENNKTIYTLSIRCKNGKKYIDQFKGKCNKDSYEGARGYFIKEKLKKIILKSSNVKTAIPPTTIPL